MRRIFFYCLPLLIALVSYSLEGAPTIYKEVDRSGNVTYTDQPDPNAKPVNLKSGTVETAPTTAPISQGSAPQTQQTPPQPSQMQPPQTTQTAPVTTATPVTSPPPPSSTPPSPTGTASGGGSAKPSAGPSNTTIAPLLQKKPPIYHISLISPAEEQTFQNGEDVVVQVAVTPRLEPGDNIIVYVDGAPATEPTNDTSITVPRLDRGEHTVQARIIQPNGTGAETQIVKIFQQRTSILLPPNRPI